MSREVSAQVLAAEARRHAALLGNDSAALAALLSERLHFMHATAQADDKSTLLAKMAAGGVIYHAIEIAEEKVVDLGETALLTMRFSAEVSVAGQRKSIRNRALAVWVREEGSWRLIAYQPTSLPA